MNQKPLPLGIDSFRKLREGDFYYSDKSMLIADFLRSGAQVTLITRPRRFGKTLNMDMVKEFFDIDADSNAIFDGLSIMDTEYRNQMNTRPVIFLSFRDCKGDRETLVSSIKSELYREYRHFYHISNQLEDWDKKDFLTVFESLQRRDIDVLPILRAIAYLSELVSKYYKKNPIILIDEYDTPMTSAYSEGCYNELRQFFTALYGSALKGNPYLDKALLTGIQRIAKENIFSGLNNLVICTVNDKAYRQYFGFSTEEARCLLEAYGFKLTDDVRGMYDGYCFGGLEAYNPWSLLSYADSGKLIPYWVNTSSNALIRKSVLAADQDFYDQFDELILDGSVKVEVNLSTSFFELEDNATLWGLLLNAGYITTIQELDLLMGFCEVRIPNREVGREFQAIVAQHTKLGGNLLNEMFYYLIQERNLERFTKIYKKIVTTATSYYDAKENAYHMLMLGMCVYLSSIYEITSNMEAGLGRSDITLRAKQSDRPHIIIEFKQGENLEQLAKEALAQIKGKQYAAGLSGEVLLMGIAHQKKECAVQTEIIKM